MYMDTVEELIGASKTKGVLPIPTVTGIPHPLEQAAGETGHRTLWAVFVIMFVSSLALYGMAWRVPANKRLFHILTALITTFATVSYFAMAVGDGISWRSDVDRDAALPAPFRREVYWARYVDWTVTTPLLLLDLSLLAGLNGANITVAVLADLIMVLTGLFAALGDGGHANSERARWGYYAMGCLAYLVIVYQLGVGGARTVRSKGTQTAKFFSAIGTFTFVLWTLYPIVWGLADGSSTLSVDQEILAYAFLDVLAKPVFGFWLLLTHDAGSESTFSLEGFWANGFSNEGAIRVGDDD